MVDTNTPTQAPQYDWENPKPQFDLGRVLGRTFSVIKENWIKFFLLSFLIAGVPLFFIGLLPFLLGGGEGMLSGNEINETAMMATVVGSILGIVVYLFASIILQSILVHQCFKHFAGSDAPLGESFRIALKYFFPLIGLTILYLLGVSFGLLLFVIPGVLLMLGWFIAVPILLVENLSVTESLSRSWKLTKGYKRWILLTFVILMVISIVLSTILSLIAVPFGDVNLAMLNGGSVFFWIFYALGTALAQALTVLINASAVAAIYYEIRDLREGITPESIASVFD